MSFNHFCTIRQNLRWHSQVVRPWPAKPLPPVRIWVPPLSNMIYIVATPIGHLGDITLRALEILRTVDLILAEDTRQTKKLLSHYQIEKKMASFHAFNESGKIGGILQELEEGKEIALVSDAGTPCICDPGHLLIEACRKQGIPISIVPGPSSVIGAIAASGFTPVPFQFLGFAPKKEQERKGFFEGVSQYEGISCFFEVPHRLISLLSAMPKEWEIFLAKEMTKIHETFFWGNQESLLKALDPSIVRGEFVLVVKPPPKKKMGNEEAEKLLKLLEEYLPHSTAAKIVAKYTGLPKKSIYRK